MTLSSDQVTSGLEIFEIKPGTKVRVQVLRQLLPDTTTALFFGKAYELDYRQLSDLLRKVFNSTVLQALLNEGDQHSSSLQNYIVDIVPPAELLNAGITPHTFTGTTTHEFLPELWDQLEVDVAASIKELVDVLGDMLNTVEGKYGTMFFSTLAKLNKQRPKTVGVFAPQIRHARVPNNLVIFDVSGSMSRETVEKIVDEVVALANKANATLAVVSNRTFFWEPGTFTREDVMRVAEFGGTHYETLDELLHLDWATVITIADYDSSPSAKNHLKTTCRGHIQQVLDISLVDSVTYLAECVGQLADEVKPMLVGSSSRVLGSPRW